MGKHRGSVWHAVAGLRVVGAAVLAGSCATSLFVAGYAVFLPGLAPAEAGVGLLAGGLSWLVGLLGARRVPSSRPLIIFAGLNVIRALCCTAVLFARTPVLIWVLTCLLLLAEGAAPRALGALVGGWSHSFSRYRLFAALQSVRNLGFAAGVGGCGAILLLDDRRAFPIALVGIAVCCLATAPLLLGVPGGRPVEVEPPAPPAPVPGAAPAEAATRRRIVRLIIAFHGLSSFCYGLVFPYTGIFLSDRPAIGTQGVAVYYAAAGTANLIVALVLALGRMRPPLVGLAMTGNVLSIIGYLAVPVAPTLPAVALAAVAAGAGQGCFLAAIIPIVNGLVPESERRSVFARRYQVLNATLAGGSLAAGGVISVFSRDILPHLFVVNALGYVPIALTLLGARGVIRAIGGGAAKDGEPAPKATPLPVRSLVRAAAAVSLFQFGVYLLGYSQFEATAPLVAAELMHFDIGWVSVLIAANVLTILLAQRPITTVLGRFPEVVGLRWAVVLWVVAYAVVGLLALVPGPFPLAGLLLYGVIFALGECAYSCSFHPWLIAKVPEGELTRANALANSMMGIGLFFGPSIGVVLMGLGSAAGLWLSLAGLCATVLLATIRRRAQPAPPPALSSAPPPVPAKAPNGDTPEPGDLPPSTDEWWAPTLELPLVRGAGTFQIPIQRSTTGSYPRVVHMQAPVREDGR